MEMQKGLPADEISLDLVQTCIFGLGVLSARKIDNFQYPLSEAFALIDWIYAKDFKTEKGLRSESTENAISTFGKLVYFHGENLSADIVTQGFLNRLPLTTDSAEAPPTHSLFFKQIIA